MEESDYCKELDPRTLDPPLCEFFLTLPEKTGDTKVIISEKLETSYLIQKISKLLSVPTDRIVLANPYGEEILQKPLTLSAFRRISFSPK